MELTWRQQQSREWRGLNSIPSQLSRLPFCNELLLLWETRTSPHLSEKGQNEKIYVFFFSRSFVLTAIGVCSTSYTKLYSLSKLGMLAKQDTWAVPLLYICIRRAAFLIILTKKKNTHVSHMDYISVQPCCPVNTSILKWILLRRQTFYLV